MERKRQTCCFTGHRLIPQKEYLLVARQLQKEIIHLIEKGVVYFTAGGALGFDTLAAQMILSLKEQYPHIKLLLILPCKSQDRFWNTSDVFLYQQIIKECDQLTYISEEYTRDCMYKRNRRLVDCSQYCICYLTKQNGGTAYTVQYAQKKNLSIINLANHFF